MTSSPAPPSLASPARRWAEVAVVLGCWSLFAPFSAGAIYVMHRVEGWPVSWPRLVAVGFLDMYLWAAISLLALALARRLPLERGRWRRSLAVHLAVALLVTVLRQAIDLGMLAWLVPRPDPFSPLLFLARLPTYLLRYLMLVGVAYGFEYFRRYRARELSAAQLESQLARAQLQMLKMQLHPHFLFNTLHAISTLVHRDPDAAERMIASLSELLRSTLAQQQAQEVTLAEELELLGTYLEIEKTRLGSRLTVELDVEPAALPARLPHLILQPLVENSIRHGLAPRRQGGTVHILARRAAHRLEIRVSDDGRGFDTARPEPAAGVGLANTRARLHQLYGAGHLFRVASAPGRGTRIDISLPLE